VTADTYTHVLLDDRELDHAVLAAGIAEGSRRRSCAGQEGWNPLLPGDTLVSRLEVP
jgi:hypothetical protein